MKDRSEERLIMLAESWNRTDLRSVIYLEDGILGDCSPIRTN